MTMRYDYYDAKEDLFRCTRPKVEYGKTNTVKIKQNQERGFNTPLFPSLGLDILEFGGKMRI